MTPTERITYDTLIALRAELGRGPTLSEIGKRMGISKAGVQRHAEALKAKGAISGPRVVGEWAPTAVGKKLRKET